MKKKNPVNLDLNIFSIQLKDSFIHLFTYLQMPCLNGYELLTIKSQTYYIIL